VTDLDRHTVKEFLRVSKIREAAWAEIEAVDDCLTDTFSREGARRTPCESKSLAVILRTNQHWAVLTKSLGLSPNSRLPMAREIGTAVAGYSEPDAEWEALTGGQYPKVKRAI